MGEDAHRAGGGRAPGALLDEVADGGADGARIVRASEQVAPAHSLEAGPGAHEAPTEQPGQLVACNLARSMRSRRFSVARIGSDV